MPYCLQKDVATSFEMKISRASIWILSGVFFGMAAVILIAFPAVMRSYDFALILFNEISQQQALDGILAAENTYGSARISEIVESFTTKQGYFLGGEYDKLSRFWNDSRFYKPSSLGSSGGIHIWTDTLANQILVSLFYFDGPVSNFDLLWLFSIKGPKHDQKTLSKNYI